MKRHGILLEVVQILADLDLLISKSYISSDGGWFMDGMFSIFSPQSYYSTSQFSHLSSSFISSSLVLNLYGVSLNSCIFFAVFHVTDKFGNKITDQDLIHYIQQVL